MDGPASRCTRLDLGCVGNRIGYRLFMKPYDGGRWRAVTRIKDDARLRKNHEESGKSIVSSAG